MKKTLLLIMVGIMVVSGCATRDDGVGQENSKQPVVTNPVSQSESNSDVSGPTESGLEEETQLKRIVPPDGSVEYNIEVPNESTELTSLSVFLPTEWVLDDGVVLDDGRVVAEFISVDDVTDKDAYTNRLEVENTEAEYGRAVDTEGVDGFCYGYSELVSEGGMTAFHNELRYCVFVGDKAVNVIFYPAFGIGIGTQSEYFEQYLATLS